MYGSLPWLIALIFAAPAAPAPAAPVVKADVDWPRFLARHDLVWKKTPARWEQGPILGNGLLGAVVFAPEPGRLVWQLGRTDVTDHRTGVEPLLARPRLPIGRLALHTAGAIDGGESRLSLWDAEWTGVVSTARGKVRLRSYVHAVEPVLLVELEPSGGEGEARIVFEPALPLNDRLVVRNLPITENELNPAPFIEEHGPVRVSVQPRRSGGEHAVAWQVVPSASAAGRRWLVLSIADSHPGAAARREAVETVRRAVAAGAPALRRSHQAFWHGYYPASFLSIPSARLESFYWIQMYKLASATRADRPAIDTLGPWYDRTPWPGVWWNLNIQLSYWPVYGANRLSLGESMLAIVDRNRQNLRLNVPAALRPDSMGVGRMGGPDAVSPIEYTGPRGPKNGAHEISNLVWVMHNYWLHWRHTMDETLLRQRLFPVLEKAVSYVMHRLTLHPDGRLHLPEAVSPEFPKTASDTNYDLSLLRWGCETLLALSKRLGMEQHPLAPRWRDVLARLTPYPVGPTGYLVGRNQPLDQSHRHFSHLLMIYPLHLVTGARPGERALIEKSLAHWIGFEGALEGYSFVGASAISSLLGKGNDAARYLDDLLRRFVKPNTMYLEAGPVIETPLAAAQAVHDMLLQSWGDTLRIFPAVPDAWKDAAFHDLRAQGAFLVSATRRAGRTVMVRVTSLAGEPATLRAGLVDPEITGAAGSIERTAAGVWRLKLARNETVVLTARDVPPALRRIEPVPHPTGEANPFGAR